LSLMIILDGVGGKAFALLVGFGCGFDTESHAL